MTDHIDVPIVATGDWIDAAWSNQYIGDNVRAWRQAYTAAGMIAYALDSNTLAGLAKPAGLGLLQNDAAGVLAWLTGGSPLQVLRKNAANNAFEFGNTSIAIQWHYNGTGHNYNSTTERDMPNSSKTLVVPVQSTVLTWAKILVANASGNCWTHYRVSIDGVPGFFSKYLYGAQTITLPAWGIHTGVAAGTITIKLREKEGYGAGLSYTVEDLEWFAVSIPEN